MKSNKISNFLFLNYLKSVLTDAFLFKKYHPYF
jgi:hypothetical protein